MPDLLTSLMILAALPYVLVPLFIYKTQRFPLKPKIREQNDLFLPRSIKKLYSRSQQRLSELGYGLRSDFVVSDMAPGMKVFVRLYANQKSNTAFQFSAIVADALPGKIFKHYMEVISKYDNGSEFITHNSDWGGLPIESKTRKINLFLNINAPAKLISLHERFLRKQLRNKKNKYLQIKPAPSESESLDYVEASILEAFVEQEKMGGIVRDKKSGQYKPSLAGAFLMAWYTMWPVSFFVKIKSIIKTKIWLRYV